MAMMDRAKSLLRDVGEKAERVTGKVLGDENMPAKDPARGLKGDLRGAEARLRDAVQK